MNYVDGIVSEKEIYELLIQYPGYSYSVLGLSQLPPPGLWGLLVYRR